MFTGIVEEVGEVLAVDRSRQGRRLRISGDRSLDDLAAGGSVNVSGACLTAEKVGSGWFEVFLAAETLDRTYLGDLAVGDRVNLERAMLADGRFDGHIVQGHVDAVIEIVGIQSLGEDWEYEFSLPKVLGGYVVEKGSIALDGISLTVATLGEGGFSVAIIPETRKRTTLSEKEVGDPIHVEVDVVAKYVERLLNR